MRIPDDSMVELVWRGDTAYVEDAHGNSAALVGDERVVNRLEQALYGASEKPPSRCPVPTLQDDAMDALEELVHATEEFLGKGTPSARNRLRIALKEAQDVLA